MKNIFNHSLGPRSHYRLHPVELERSQNSNAVRVLPGCRSCSLDWGNCKLSVADDEVHDVVRLEMNFPEIKWTRTLPKIDGLLPCTLQELEIMRWIAEEEPESPAATIVRGSGVKYTPIKRYPCLYPHELEHEVLEIVPGMTDKEILEAGEDAINRQLVLLCPAPASTCGEKVNSNGNPDSHPDVQAEVRTLAAKWPVRQCLAANTVEKGIVDITPVATCRDTASSHGGSTCCLWQPVGEVKSDWKPPKEIRTHKTKEDLRWILQNRGGKQNDLALHDSWDGATTSQIAPAVMALQHRRATVNPTRLYDTEDATIEEGLRVTHYIAISYCWSDWPKPDGDEMLRKKLKTLSAKLGVRYFWVDRWCVMQEKEEDKAREIPRMRDYYKGASACVVMIGPHEGEHFGCVPQQSGMILSAAQQLRLNGAGLTSLVESNWASRVWTLQEALMPRQVVYAVRDQLIDGDFVSELLAYAEHAHNGTTDHFGCYRWDPNYPVIISPRHIMMEKGQLAITRSIFGGEQQYNELCSEDGSVLMSFEEALALVHDRIASVREDYIYGVLGMSMGGQKISVEYGIDWRKMLEKVKVAGLLTERQLAAPSINKQPELSWLPENNDPAYGPFLNGERLAVGFGRPKLIWSEQGATVIAAEFTWKTEHLHYFDWRTNNIHNMPCQAVRGLIEVEGIMALVCATSSKHFLHTKRLEGTHLMLCRETGQETIGIRVSGDLQSGHVRREDGYVLELHHWVEPGHPNLLKGRRWFIGI